MAQTAAIYRQLGDSIDHTPDSDVAAGQVVLIGTTFVAIAPVAIASGVKGAVNARGIWNVPKDNSDVAKGDPLYWDANGSPVGGTALSGAFTKTTSGNTFAGIAMEAAGTTVGDVDMFLRSIDGTIPGSFAPLNVATIVVGGTAIANANAVSYGYTLVTGADDTAAIKLPEAAAGAVCVVKNGVTNKILKVFPAVNDTINGAAANAVYNQTNGAFRMYVAYNAVAWHTDPEVIA